MQFSAMIVPVNSFKPLDGGLYLAVRSLVRLENTVIWQPQPYIILECTVEVRLVG